MREKEHTRNMVLTAVFASIIVIMALIPFLGYIPIGFMNATIIQIPVIIGAIMLGPKKGVLLGGVFAVSSLWKNTYMPNPTSFVFSPFITVGEYSGNLNSLVVCFVPRIMIGLVAYGVFFSLSRFLKDKKCKMAVSLTAAGVAGSLTNTVLVMNFIYFLFGSSYAKAADWASGSIYGVIMGIIFMQGIPEAIISGILTFGVAKVMFQVMKQ